MSGALLEARHAVALVVSDVTMPGISGLDLTERIRAQHSGVAVILMTGDGHVNAPDGIPLLRKPFAADALLALVDDALSA